MDLNDLAVRAAIYRRANKDLDAPQRVAVAIVSYGPPQTLARCLAAVSRSTHDAYEVVVVENGGPAAFGELERQLSDSELFRPAAANDPPRFADVTGLAEPSPRHLTLRLVGGGQAVSIIEAPANLGYAGGINLALATLANQPGWHGAWILNSDTEPTPDALHNLLAHVAAGDYGLTGCRVASKDSRTVETRGGIWRWWTGCGLALGIGQPVEAPVRVAAIEAQLDWVAGAAMYATRAFIETVGPLDERYFLHCEDVDWSLRRGRFRLGYAHDALVYHAHAAIKGPSPTPAQRAPLSIYLAERNKLMLTRRYFLVGYPLVALACLIGLARSYLSRADVGASWLALRAGFAGWWAGVRGEQGRPTRSF